MNAPLTVAELHETIRALGEALDLAEARHAEELRLVAREAWRAGHRAGMARADEIATQRWADLLDASGIAHLTGESHADRQARIRARWDELSSGYRGRGVAA